MNYPPCIARVKLSNGESCLHHSSGRFKEVVTPIICQNCPYKGGTELRGPSTLKKLSNAAKAAAQAAANPVFASEDEQARRLGICGLCKFQSTANSCTACGCNLRYKVKLETWKCDLGFWDAGADPPPAKDQE